MNNERYWIAINGPSCALCAIPLREPLVTPIPEELFGFPTLEEAERAQRICLMDPIKKVQRFIQKELGLRIRLGQVHYIRPKHPQPPTKETTAWTESDEAHAIMQRAFIAGSSN
jgi:hypothetical protein